MPQTFRLPTFASWTILLILLVSPFPEARVDRIAGQTAMSTVTAQINPQRWRLRGQGFQSHLQWENLVDKISNRI